MFIGKGHVATITNADGCDGVTEGGRRTRTICVCSSSASGDVRAKQQNQHDNGVESNLNPFFFSFAYIRGDKNISTDVHY